MKTRAEFEAAEVRNLAGYAACSRDSRGREHPEDEHPFRTAFQRDRDRVIHSAAFRRLEYKTQVFVNHEGDHYRTRLTHSLEAAQIARTVARALQLNEDLTEAVTLAHDLGHTPFGHSGQETMNTLMQDHGGFEHNLQSLRTVDELENRYPGFHGLNLSYEVREGILKHSPKHRDHGSKIFRDGKQPVLEAQIVDIADEIAYTNHDLEDGLASGILELDALESIELWRDHFGAAAGRYPLEPSTIQIRMAIRGIINALATDLIEETLRTIEIDNVRTLEDVRNQPKPIVRFTSAVAEQKTRLKSFLFTHLYRHYRVARMNEKAKRVVRELFEGYTAHPIQLPPHVSQRIPTVGLERVVCDYIAGMTDRFALEEHRKLFDPHERV